MLQAYTAGKAGWENGHLTFSNCKVGDVSDIKMHKVGISPRSDVQNRHIVGVQHMLVLTYIPIPERYLCKTFFLSILGNWISNPNNLPISFEMIKFI